jgi:FkbM family methyltransferase
MTLLLNYNNYVDRRILVDGFFEKEQLSLLGQLIATHKCSEFYDIGANIGLYSLTFSRQFSDLSIHAFEPDPRNSAQLAANLLLNSATHRIHTYSLGISSSSGLQAFYMHRSTNTGRSKLNTGNTPINADDNATINISTVTIDSIVNTSNSSLCFKIDVEGHELSVIDGMQRTLSNNQCVLQIEIKPENYSDATLRLSKLGYNEIRRIDDDYFFIREGNLSGDQ